MNTNNSNPHSAIPWYVAGLAFECTQCSRCCAGPEEGYVWAKDEEIAAAAKFLRMSEKSFRDRYVRKIGKRYSFIEKENKDCCFLGTGGCRIYDVRPTQCRTWPFWESNIDTPDDWAEAGRRCLGINRGTLFSPEEINKQARRTQE